MVHSTKISYGYITPEKGIPVPLHQHPHEQWIFIAEGEMEFTLDGETQLLLPGMGAFIDSNILHGAYAVTVCKVIDVFSPLREDYPALEKKQVVIRVLP